MSHARWTLAVAAVAMMPAQVRVDMSGDDGRTMKTAFDQFWSADGTKRLACRVTPIEPRLGMSFRIFAGFQSVLDLTQIPAKETRVAVMFRVRPKSKPPVPHTYFWEGLLIPEAAKRPQRPEAFFSGGFYVGPGEYEVEWVMSDDGVRVCRSTWTISTKRTRASQTALKAYAIEPLGLESWRGAEPKPNGKRATIFLNAAPLWRSRYFTRLNAWDRSLLLGSLTALLDLGGFKSARVVAYDMAGRRILFEEPDFSRASYGKLSQSLREANFGLIDYAVLKDGPSEGDYIASLLKKDRAIPQPSEVVIFLGPELQSTRRITPLLEELAPSMPRSYYLALGREPVMQGDVISKFVKAVKGKTFLVMRGSDLLKPIRAVTGDQP
jgi:hypothetical protein